MDLLNNSTNIMSLVSIVLLLLLTMNKVFDFMNTNEHDKEFAHDFHTIV